MPHIGVCRKNDGNLTSTIYTQGFRTEISNIIEYLTEAWKRGYDYIASANCAKDLGMDDEYRAHGEFVQYHDVLSMMKCMRYDCYPKPIHEYGKIMKSYGVKYACEVFDLKLEEVK